MYKKGFIVHVTRSHYFTVYNFKINRLQNVSHYGIILAP